MYLSKPYKITMFNDAFHEDLWDCDKCFNV
jgi:hypothetical protein